MKVPYYIGCSGFSSRNWKDNFYRGIPSSRWLEHYSSVFNSVEINSSFYKLPVQKTLEKWNNSTPLEFRFSLKAPRSITHYGKFTNIEEELISFYKLAANLKEKLGAILFQLPPGVPYTEEMLHSILSQLSGDFINAVEFRNPSWWNDKVFAAFKKQKVIFCNVSMGNLPEVVTSTSDVSYTRLHGKPQLFKSSYTIEELLAWKKKLKAGNFSSNFFYFNNTWFTAALENAQSMQKIEV